MNKGFFLALEGGEGTGKSTVTKWLKAKLEKKGYSVYLTRQEFDRLDNETLKFHQRVRETYLKLAQENPQLFRVINARQPIEKVQIDTWKELINKIKEVNYDKN